MLYPHYFVVIVSTPLAYVIVTCVPKEFFSAYVWLISCPSASFVALVALVAVPLKLSHFSVLVCGLYVKPSAIVGIPLSSSEDDFPLDIHTGFSSSFEDVAAGDMPE
jgi:hypothetical protein